MIALRARTFKILIEFLNFPRNEGGRKPVDIYWSFINYFDRVMSGKFSDEMPNDSMLDDWRIEFYSDLL